MRQEYDGAEQQYNDLIAADPTATRPRIALAELQLLEGKSAQAEQGLSDILAKDPANEASLAAVVPILLNTNNTARATLVLESAATAAPDNKKIGQALSLVYLRAGHPEKALDELNLMIGKGESPTIDQLQLRAAAQQALRRTPEAIETLNQLLLKSPNNIAVIRELTGLHIEAKNYIAALDVVQTALKTQPTNLVLLRLLVSTDLAQGGDSAVAARLEKLRQSPDTKDLAAVLQADFDVYRHRYLEAAEEYAAIYKTNLVNGPAVNAAQAYMLAGQPVLALDILKTKLDNAPDDVAALTMASDIHIGAQQLAEAAPLLEHILALQPANPAALNNLAWVYAAQKNPRAVEYGRRAFALYPSPATGETLGWALTQSGDANAGLLLMTKAASAMPDDPTVQYHYAVTLNAVGNKTEALAVSQKLAELVQPFPEQAEARKLAQDLKNAR